MLRIQPNMLPIFCTSNRDFNKICKSPYFQKIYLNNLNKKLIGKAVFIRSGSITPKLKKLSKTFIPTKQNLNKELITDK